MITEAYQDRIIWGLCGAILFPISVWVAVAKGAPTAGLFTLEQVARRYAVSKEEYRSSKHASMDMDAAQIYLDRCREQGIEPDWSIFRPLFESYGNLLKHYHLLCSQSLTAAYFMLPWFLTRVAFHRSNQIPDSIFSLFKFNTPKTRLWMMNQKELYRMRVFKRLVDTAYRERRLYHQAQARPALAQLLPFDFDQGKLTLPQPDVDEIKRFVNVSSDRAQALVSWYKEYQAKHGAWSEQ